MAPLPLTSANWVQLSAEMSSALHACTMRPLACCMQQIVQCSASIQQHPPCAALHALACKDDPHLPHMACSRRSPQHLARSSGFWHSMLRVLVVCPEGV